MPASRTGVNPIRICRALALSLALLLAAPGEEAAAQVNSAVGAVEVLAAGDLRGEIVPCGCSPEFQWGGLARRLTFLRQARDGASAGAPIVVDLGNNFPEPTEQGKLKIELIQDLLRQVPPDAILPGPNELAIGLGLLDRALPYLISNDAVGRSFLREAIVSRQGSRVGIFGYLSPEAVYQEFAGQYRLLALDADWIARIRERIRANGVSRAILLFRGSDAELAALHRTGLFDLIVSGNPFDDELNQVVQRRAGGVVFAQVPTKGQGFHRLSLRLDGGLETPLGDPVWLKEDFADDPVAVHAFAIYNEKVKGQFFARLESVERSRAESPYAGAAVCAACHPKASAIWNSSRHGHALPTLVRVKKQFDAECLACHVLGLADNGYLSQELTPHLGNVQCENCHGPAKAHAADPMAENPPRDADVMSRRVNSERICRGCHHGSHSPSFNFSTYWPKIAHGKE